MELGEHDNTVKPYNPINTDTTTSEKPDSSGSPGAHQPWPTEVKRE